MSELILNLTLVFVILELFCYWTITHDFMFARLHCQVQLQVKGKLHSHRAGYDLSWTGPLSIKASNTACVSLSTSIKGIKLSCTQFKVPVCSHSNIIDLCSKGFVHRTFSNSTLILLNTFKNHWPWPIQIPNFKLLTQNHSQVRVLVLIFNTHSHIIS